MSACSLAAIAVLLAPPALDSPARIAVIVQGQQGEGAEAGRVQAEIEKELNLRQAAVKSAAELAQKLAMAAETPVPAPPLLLESAKTKIDSMTILSTSRVRPLVNSDTNTAAPSPSGTAITIASSVTEKVPAISAKAP